MYQWDRVPEKYRAILDANGFDLIPFEQLAGRLRQNGFDSDHNRLDGSVEPPPQNRLHSLPEPESREADRLRAIGLEAIFSGHVGVIVLNGGMATRFGGGTKGVQKAALNRSFLDLKLSQIHHVSEGRAPVFLMNSFATEEDTQQHLLKIDLNHTATCFNQLVSLRLTPSGDLFFDARGLPSLHAPGHGDLTFAVKRSGVLAQFIDNGGRYLTLSNVDNLGAGLDPVVIGAHVERKSPMTVELARKFKGDVGGFPALVNGNLTIVEAFRAPAQFDQSQVGVFNTNTFVFDAPFLAKNHELDWLMVKKEVDGQVVIQFERLVGQLADHCEVTWLIVPRTSERSRFIPIKAPEDLQLQQNKLEAILRFQGIV